MDIPRLIAMKEYQEQNPPIHIMVKHYLGFKDKKSDKGDIAELMAMAPQTSGA